MGFLLGTHYLSRYCGVIAFEHNTRYLSWGSYLLVKMWTKVYLQITMVKQPKLKNWIHFFQVINVVQAATTHFAVFATQIKTPHCWIFNKTRAVVHTYLRCAHMQMSLLHSKIWNWPHPSSHSDPMHTLNSRSVSLHTVCTRLWENQDKADGRLMVSLMP